MVRNIEEAEIRENGDVIIRYYYGKTVVIPAKVIQQRAVVWYPLSERVSWVAGKENREVV
jgi:hypothetical protein